MAVFASSFFRGQPIGRAPDRFGEVSPHRRRGGKDTLFDRSTRIPKGEECTAEKDPSNNTKKG